MDWNDLTFVVEVSNFLFSLDLALETEFQNKAKRLVYVVKFKLTNLIILDSVTCRGLLDFSFLLNDS